MITVKITAPRRRLVYINGVYDESVTTLPDVLSLPPGSHLFETVNGDDAIDFRGRVRNIANGATVTIALDAVVPPEPI